MFFANNSPVLGEYETKPYDEFSSFTRSEDGFGDELYINEKISQFKISGRDIKFSGVYEEITPLSTYFPEIDGAYKLPDQTMYTNELFYPIVLDTECGQRILGVKFKNCKDIKTLIKHYSTEINKDVYIYGSYTIHAPKYSVEFAPNSDFNESPLSTNMVTFNIFIPLGVLNQDIKTYSLGKQFIKEYGPMLIEMNGVYVKLGQDKVTYYSDQGKVKILNKNEYENEYNKLSCNYWLACKIDLTSNIYRDTEPSLTTTSDGINFFLSDEYRKLLTNVETASGGALSWWLQTGDDMWSGVWRKRNFDIITVDLRNDLTTNLNYFGYDESPMVSCDEQRNRAAQKVFYGNKIGGYTYLPDANLNSLTRCITANNPLTAIQVRLTDSNDSNPLTSNTTYYAKITVRMNYSGFDQDDIDILPENEKDNISVVGSKKKDKFKKAPVNKCIELYVPFAWYDENHLPEGRVIEYGTYARGSYGTSTSPVITFAPIGLLTELLNKMDAKNREVILSSDIDLSEWNKYLLDNMSIDFIAEPIPASVCKLYKNYGMFNSLNLNMGSFVEIEYNKSNLEWDVTEKSRYFFDGSNENFFELPSSINTIESWIDNIRNVTLNSYILDPSLYTITTDNLLVLNVENISEYLNGSSMIGKYMLNLYLDVSEYNLSNYTYEEYVQNFNTQNSIKFVPYEGTSLDPYRIVERTATENLIFSSTDKLFETIQVGGKIAMQVDVDKSKIKTLQGKVGSYSQDKKINSNLSSMPDIQKLFVIDEKSPVFDLEASVYFDGQLDTIGDYRGKKLEFVIKADNTYNKDSNQYVLSDYYFVGIGTYDFDCALGLAKYDTETKTLKKTILVGFGDYNTKNIKSNTWYKLRVIATKTYIRVIFNELNEPERLVINYNISSKNSDIAGTNAGNYEELVYLVKGLSNLDITYLNNIGQKTGSDFVNGNVDTSLITNKRPSGFMSGFAVYNNLTYVTDIKYRIQKPKIRKFANVEDNTELTTVLSLVEDKYGTFDNVKFVGKTLNNTLILHIDDALYYMNTSNDPVKFIKEDVLSVSIYNNMIIVTSRLNNATNIVIWTETFKNQFNVFLKDNNFNIDHIYRYLAYTQRNIQDIYINNGQINVVLNTL